MYGSTPTLKLDVDLDAKETFSDCRITVDHEKEGICETVGTEDNGEVGETTPRNWRRTAFLILVFTLLVSVIA